MIPYMASPCKAKGGKPPSDQSPSGDAPRRGCLANNLREVAMTGNIRGTVQAAFVRAVLSRQARTSIC
jgi:hypothetical protein